MKVIFKMILVAMSAVFTTTVNAKTDTLQNLTAKQWAIVSIASVTAKGEL